MVALMPNTNTEKYKMSFASLKKASGSSFAKLTKEIEKLQKPAGSAQVDERLWKPSLDKSGNGYAVIRFLPEPEGEELPWAQVWSHAFQGPGGWYIENSLTTLGQKDPVSDLNRELWNSGKDSDKEIARKQKRKLSYYSNIYVVKDEMNPENEGKVFLYKYGKKIHDKIVAAAQPEFEDETPINPFDLWKGADFRLKICKVAGFWNYDKSGFANPSTLEGKTDAELEATWKQCYSLKDFTSQAQFKTYEELETRLNSVLKVTPKRPDPETFEEEDTSQSVPDLRTGFGNKVESLQKDDDVDLSYFAKLAEED
tara:strand:+ start:5381 stop:6316 length:936 start_codon:yes stop_codon:yes gene_type:complete